MHFQVHKTPFKYVGVRSFLPKNNTIIALLPPSKVHRLKHVRPTQRRRPCHLNMTATLTTIQNEMPIKKTHPCVEQPDVKRS